MLFDKSNLKSPSRRRLLKTASSAILAGGVWGYEHFTGKISRWGIPIELYFPGMAEGHALREAKNLPQPSNTIHAGIAIVGSGVAGLYAAWYLHKAGRRDVLLVEGPEFGGNTAGGAFDWSGERHLYPRGAHYLPLPSIESTHVRDLLTDMGVLISDAQAAAPIYDEKVLVYAPEERVWDNQSWHEGVMAEDVMDEKERKQVALFFDMVEKFKHARGNDGKRAFVVPIAMSSTDSAWRALDDITFESWFKQQGFDSKRLAWYLDYACRDDYGISWTQTSAWAGLHYFASRDGKATVNGEVRSGVMLTWPNGLQPIADFMSSHLTAQQRVRGTATLIEKLNNTSMAINVWQPQSNQSIRIVAEHVICATPLHVTQHIVQDLPDWGFYPDKHQPQHATWQVNNFLIRHTPAESPNTPLAWENLVADSPSLGFINSSHQLLRRHTSGTTVLTSYHAHTQANARQNVLKMSIDELFDIATNDLNTVYGKRWMQSIEKVEITLRGHAMSSPTVGFLNNQGLIALRQNTGKLQFAHSDLSSLSIFEEAAWWGLQAAKNILKN